MKNLHFARLFLITMIFTSNAIFAADANAPKPLKKNSEQEFSTISEAKPTGSHPFGLGVMLGEPTGVNGKYWLSDTTAVDSGLAWSFAGGQTAFHIHSDYLFHNFGLFKMRDHELQFYFGGGARLKFADRTKFGIRVPVGMAYKFDQEPIDLFFELAPIVDLAPNTEISINLGVGARYYF